MPGVDGFDVFYGGFRGVTIRAAVLLPYLLSCLMDRKYTGVILCILAEACIVWTLYGAGVCLLVTVAWLILGALVSQFRKRWEKRKMTDAHGRSGEEATE
jgi:membrane-bound ClpP family serine protease